MGIIEGDQVLILGSLDVLATITVSDDHGGCGQVTLCRPAEEGGDIHGSIEEQPARGSTASQSGADVDKMVLVIEWEDDDRWRQVVSGDDPYIYISFRQL